MRRASCVLLVSSLLAGCAERDEPLEDPSVYRAQLEAMLAGVRVMLAVERFRHAEGRLPRTLDELTPACLGAIPIDPTTGGPMLYRVTPDDPHGRAYLVYAAGPDGVDDGGRATADALGAMAPLGAPAGFDLVVNRPRPGLDGDRAMELIEALERREGE